MDVKKVKKLNLYLRVLQVIVAIALAVMMARAMKVLFFLMKGETLF